tara:strand:+ start:693 stop:1895 length:1203 start_codon:yes stop_codon:yes gene_type:complete
MLSFKQYITEGKNTHLIHLEDLAFEGSERVKEGIYFLEELAQMLSGNSNAKVNASVKWDGAPAIICGKNPENGKFFVGTKSVFNKRPKVNYTVADIRKNHTSGVGDKLVDALKNLKDLPIRGVLQGDMMFGSGDTKIETIKGESYITFTPNTITYAVPSKSDLGKKIKQSKFGIVFHTEYKGKTLSKMSSKFNPNVDTLKRSKKVWIDDAKFKDTSGTASLTLDETQKLYDSFNDINRHLKWSSGFLNKIKEDKKMFSLLNIYVNVNIRSGSESLSGESFIKWLDNRLEAEVANMKSERGKENKRRQKDETIKKFKEEGKSLDAMFKLRESLRISKMIILRKLEKVEGMSTFIRTDNGFKVTKQEGYVGVDRLTDSAIKLVDRLEFSKANFSVPKNWIKG